jgi:hypothetical protein
LLQPKDAKIPGSFDANVNVIQPLISTPRSVKQDFTPAMIFTSRRCQSRCVSREILSTCT